MPLLEALKTLRNMAVSGNVPDEYFGICWNAKFFANSEIGSEAYELCADISPSWQYFSGSEICPIPKRKLAETHKWQGGQLNYRLSLINHMINKIEGIV